MKRLYRYIFFILLSCKTFALYSQGYFITRNLLDSTAIKNKQIIVLKETDSFIIASPFKKFADDLKYSKKDKELLLLFEKKTVAVLYADSTVIKSIHKSRLLNTTAALLQSGSCLVYNKLSGLAEKTITIENFHANTTKGRRFKNKEGIILLEITDRRQ